MNEEIQAKVMSSEEARRLWRSMIDAVVAGEDVVVKRYEHPAVAVIAYEDYKAIHHELEELRAIRRTKHLQAAWKAGKLKALPWDESAADELVTGSQVDARHLNSGGDSG